MQEELPVKQWNKKLSTTAFMLKQSLLPTFVAEFASTPKKKIIIIIMNNINLNILSKKKT
jgi:hypothetical protein